MTPKIFLATATLLLACGSANAFNLGGFIQKGGSAIGGAIGNTSCTATKCGAPNLGSDTVSTCFKKGDAVIQQNPNCATAFFNQQCQGQPTQFGDSCAEVGRVIGRPYAAPVVAAPPAAPQYQPAPAAAPHYPQQPMNQGGYNNQYQQHPAQQMNQGYHPQQRPQPPMNQGYKPQQQQGGYNNHYQPAPANAPAFVRGVQNQYQQQPPQQNQGGYNQYQQQSGYDAQDGNNLPHEDANDFHQYVEDYGQGQSLEGQEQNYGDEAYAQ